MISQTVNQESAVGSENLSPVGRIRRRLANPGSYFRFRGGFSRSLYHKASRYLHGGTYLSRCIGIEREPVPEALLIPEDRGFVKLSTQEVGDLPLAEAVEEVRARVARLDIQAEKAASKKPYLLQLFQASDFDRGSAVYKLVTHPTLVGAAARYLGAVPLLTYISVWYSPNDERHHGSSQEFHLDHEDFRQIKGFVFIEDVDDDCGPFSLIQADKSQEIARRIGYRMTASSKRLTDERVYGSGTDVQLHRLTGAAGSLAMVDTSRCFHFGSREGRKPRVLLAFQYMTPFAFVLPWFWQKGDLLRNFWSEDLNPLEGKVLGAHK
ncbi:MAG: hypothetical protein WEA09_04060 [Gemmatimonadota bacterium]